MLADLSLDYRKGLPLSASDHNFEDGDVIFREGDRSQAAFVLVSGQVELIKKTTNGLVRLALISPGEIFGEMGIIDRSVRSATDLTL